VYGLIYRKIAEVLTEFENHKTTLAHNSNLFRKLTAFYFVNNFGTLIYIAFIKVYRIPGVRVCCFFPFKNYFASTYECRRRKFDGNQRFSSCAFPTLRKLVTCSWKPHMFVLFVCLLYWLKFYIPKTGVNGRLQRCFHGLSFVRDGAHYASRLALLSQRLHDPDRQIVDFAQAEHHCETVLHGPRLNHRFVENERGWYESIYIMYIYICSFNSRE